MLFLSQKGARTALWRWKRPEISVLCNNWNWSWPSEFVEKREIGNEENSLSETEAGRQLFNMRDIAVIIPVNNGSEFLLPCVKSVLLAGERVSEIIIVDDDSTDATLAIASSLSAEEPRISVLRTQCHSSYSARLLGIRAARAPYIAFLDVDDCYCTGALDMLAGVLESFDADIAMGGAIEPFTAETIKSCVCPGTAQATTCVHTPAQIWPRIMKWKTQEFLPYVWNKLYRRELFDRLPELDRICQGDDLILTCGALLRAKRIAETSMPVCLHHVNMLSLTHQGFSDTDLDLIRVWDEVVKMVDEEDSEEIASLDMIPSLPYLCCYNRWRTDFTLICRLILTDDKEADKRYAKELSTWRTSLNAHWRDLVRPHAMPRNREGLIIALRFFFGPTKALMRIGKRLTNTEIGVLLHSGDKR